MAGTDKRASELTAPVSIEDSDTFPGYRPGTGGDPNLDIRGTAGLIRAPIIAGLASGDVTVAASGVVTEAGHTVESKLRNWFCVTDQPYGAVGDWNGTTGTDNTAAFAAAITAAHQTALLGGTSGVVYVPPGAYLVDKVTLQSFVKIKGSGQRSSLLVASANPSNGLVEQASGAVLNTGMCDIGLMNSLVFGGSGAPRNANQWAMYLDGTQASGGLWYSQFENIECYYWNNGIQLIGSSTLGPSPQQFNSFKQVNCSVYSATGIPLKIVGHCDHENFQDCLLEHIAAVPGAGSSPCLFMGANGGSALPSNVQLLGCTLQNAAYGCIVDGQLEVIGGHLENLGTSYKIGASGSLKTWGGRYASAAYGAAYGGSAGAIIEETAGCFARMEAPTFSGTTDNRIKYAGSTTSKSRIYNSIQSVAIASTGTSSYDTNAAAVLDVGNALYVRVNTSATQITTFNGTHCDGEFMTVGALSGSIVFASGGNMVLPSSPITIPANGTALLRKRTASGIAQWTYIGPAFA